MKNVVLGIILGIISLVGAQIMAQLLSSLIIIMKLPKWMAYILFGCTYISLAWFFASIVCKKILHTTMHECRIGKIKIRGAWILCGILLPAIVTGIMLCMPGELISNSMRLQDKVNVIFLAIFYYGLGAGVVEEIIFRGLIMKTLEEKFSKKIAIIIPSMLFGLLHASSGMHITDILLLFIAGTSVGIMFSLIVYRSGSVWSSAIVHCIWNVIIIGGILKIGIEHAPEALFSYKLNLETLFITGGKFGIEASGIAIGGYMVVILLLLFLDKKNPSFRLK